MKEKDMIGFIEEDGDIEFRLLEESGNKYETLDIISRGFCFIKGTATNIIEFKRKKVIEISEEIPMLFNFDGKLIKLKRVTYMDGTVEYKEEDVTHDYRNEIHFTQMP